MCVLGGGGVRELIFEIAATVSTTHLSVFLTFNCQFRLILINKFYLCVLILDERRGKVMSVIIGNSTLSCYLYLLVSFLNDYN